MKKNIKRLVGLGLTCTILSALFPMSISVSAWTSDELSDTSNFECVGELTENFDGLENAEALYTKSGTGVLSGTWRTTELSQWGKGNNEVTTLEDSNKVLTMTAEESWAKPGGVDFVFDTSLAPDYILDISYDMYFSGTDIVAAALFSNGNFDNNDNAGVGRRMSDENHSFQILSGDGNNKGKLGTYNMLDSGKVTVKGVYNLQTWTYDAKVLVNDVEQSSVLAGKIGPTNWDDPACIPGSTYEKFSFAVQVGSAYVDNLSIKAYKIQSDMISQMTETFTGKSAGQMSNVHAEDGIGTWISNTAWGENGIDYVTYTNHKTNTEDIGIKANGDWKRLQYVPGVNFSKTYGDNCEITFGFDFTTPDATPSGWAIMEWGDGFTNKYRNIPFFAMLVNGDNWSFTRPNNTTSTSENWGTPLAILEKNKTYTYEGKIYPQTEMVYATVKEGDNVVYSGSYRAGQWRMWTEGINVHTMSFTEGWSTGIIYDNFKMSAKQITPFAALGENIDFNKEIVDYGFKEVTPFGTASIIEAPQNGTTLMGKALALNGDSEGVALKYFSEPVTNGIYRYTTKLYNKNSDSSEEDSSEGQKNSKSRVMIDAPKNMDGYEGSLTLALLEANTVSLGTDDKIAVAPNEWIGIETIIDLNNKKTYLAAYDKDGHKLGVVSADFFANDNNEETTYEINSLNSIRIRNWNSTDSGIPSIVDDMKLEKLNGKLGFIKNGESVTSVTPGDNLGVGFVLTDLPDETSSETCIVAYYDENGNQLISVDIPTITVQADSIFCVCENATTVPENAVSAKAFVWDMSTLKPLAETAVLTISQQN